jgi:putative salt-induced outer membrane protein YdiY
MTQPPFRLPGGKGVIEIAYPDIQAIRSETAFVILLGDSGEVRGHLWGVEGDRLLVGPEPAAATPVPLASIQRSLTVEAFDTSALERLRARTRLWSGHLDLGFAYTDATTDTLNFSAAVELQRKTTGSRLLLGGTYRLGTERKSGEDQQTVENRLAGRLRYDRDLVGRLFGYGEVTGEYDEVQLVSLRLIPVLGVGYRILQTDRLVLEARTGAGYVYERFFDATSNDYITASFGGGLELKLPLESTLEARVEYLPSVEDWVGTYLVRGSASWRMPLLSWLDFKLTVQDDYTSRPAEGTQPNSFTSLAGLSLRY